MPICVEQAVELSRSAARLLEEEEIPLSQALGRTLSRPLFALCPQPPFDRSPLDGYALLPLISRRRHPRRRRCCG